MQRLVSFLTRTGGTRLGLALVSLCGLVAASHAGTPDLAPLPIDPAAHPGWYVVSCGSVGFGTTQKDATKACDKALDPGSRKACACGKHGDSYQFDVKLKPTFWVAGDYYKGTTPARATAECKAIARRTTRGLPPADRNIADFDCERVTAVYGPFERKRARYPYGDEDFRYLTAAGLWVDETGNGPCFVAGTPVLTPTGERAIESLQPGDAVLSWSDATHAPSIAHIVRVKPKQVDSVVTLAFEDGRVLQLTENHPLRSLTRDAWVPAGELALGEHVAMLRGGALEAIALRAKTSPPSAGAGLTVYDLTVVPSHSYFANGVWAHNY